jgi:arginyl-tRNA synthetase
MKKEITLLLVEILNELGVSDIIPNVELSDNPEHGEYSTNIAMRLTKVLNKAPMDIALQVVERIKRQWAGDRHEIHDQISAQSDQMSAGELNIFSVLRDIESVEAVKPGFINFKISEAKLSSQIAKVLAEGNGYGKGQKISVKASEHQSVKASASDSLTLSKVMVEFAHPNTHKAFHIGHLRNITTGEAMVRLLESQGVTVVRANYQGDVGMHIAKAMYALLNIAPFKDDVKTVIGLIPRVEFLGKAYACGSQAFEADEKAKSTIKDYNYLIYAAAAQFAKERGLPPISTDYLKFVEGRTDDVQIVYDLWKETRQWSLDYFDYIYKRVGTHYDRFYFESECLSGVEKVKVAVKKGVLAESEGAIIFNGKKYGLDTRVFVNSLGLPTYEGKELALASLELSEHGQLDRIIHVVGPEQASFFKVTFKVEELLGMQFNQQKHLIYGWVKLKNGKMSSRLGNVVLGMWLLDEAKKEIYNILQNSKTKDNKGDQKKTENQDWVEAAAEAAAISAVKYAFLKVGTTQEVAFDFAESISFSGDSGPYLLYTYARCKSVLRKASECQSIRVSEEASEHQSGTASEKASEHQSVRKSFRASECQSIRVSEAMTLDALTLSALPDVSTLHLNSEEHAIARLILLFPEILAEAVNNYSPNTLCKYLFDLAQAYNLFYAKHTILGDTSIRASEHQRVTASERQGIKASGHQSVTVSSFDALTPEALTRNYRLLLTQATAQVLKNGLYLLGISTVERM